MSQTSSNPNPGSRISQTLGNTSARLIAVHVKSANKSIFRALLRLGSANLLTRIAGLGMNVIVAAQFGLDMDPYQSLYLLITTLAQLFGGGLEASVIPVYSRVRVKGKDKVSIFFSTVLNLLILFLLLLMVVLFIFRRQFIFAGAPGIADHRIPHTNLTSLDVGLQLAPFLFPVLVLMSLNYFMECILNAEGQYGWPAYAGMVVPISQGVALLISRILFGAATLQVLCMGLLAGLTLQLCAVVVRAHMAHITYRPVINLKTPELKAVLLAIGPPAFSSLIALSGPWLDNVFTSLFGKGDGYITALSNATKITTVFTGVIFGSVAKAALPYLSGQAAIKDWKNFKATLRLYIWALGIGMSILTAGVLLFAPLIVHILFERGKFDAAATQTVTPLLRALMLGLPPMAIAFFTSRAFSAIGKTRVLMYSTILNMILNGLLDAVFGYFLRPYGLGPLGVALATSVFYFVSMFFLLIVLRRYIGPLNIFTPPPELLALLKKVGGGQTSELVATWWDEHMETLGFTHAMKRKLIRGIFMLSVFTAGIIGAIANALLTARIAFGSIVLLLLARYPFSLLLAWIMLGSFVGSDVPFLSIFQGGNLLSGLAIGTIFTFLVIPAKPAIKRFSSLGFLAVYLLWVFLSIGFSEIGLQQFLTLWLVMISYVAIGVLTIALVNTRKRLDLLLDSMLVIMTFIAAYGIYDWFPGLPYGGRSTGFYDTDIASLYRLGSVYATTTVAYTLSIMIPFGLYRILTVKRAWSRLLAILSTLVMTVAFAMTFARIPFAGFALSLFVMAIFLPNPRMRAGAVAGLVAIGGGGLAVLQLAGIPLLSRFANSDISTLNGRTQLWTALLDSFDPHKILGAGLQGSDIFLINAHVGTGLGVVATAPHNIFLQAMYDQGLVGLVLVILLHLALLWNLLNGLRGASPARHLLIATTLAAYTNILVQSTETTVFWSQQVGPYLWILLSLPFATYWDNEEKEAPTDQETPDLQTTPRIEPIEQTQQQEQLIHV